MQVEQTFLQANQPVFLAAAALLCGAALLYLVVIRTMRRRNAENN